MNRSDSAPHARVLSALMDASFTKRLTALRETLARTTNIIRRRALMTEIMNLESQAVLAFERRR